MRRGVHPARVAFLALDAKGNPGAAATPRTNFQYAVAKPGSVELLKAKEIEPVMR
jgi:N4-(beta-N-acetylglucosaminyl)-L-asparaginase